jgi:asparagine synthase (glutamine-hydrolysing)
MLQAVSHRGAVRDILSLGSCLLGVAHHADTPDAWLAEDGEWGCALTGHLDDAGAVAGRLGLDAAQSSPARIVLEAFRRHGPGAPNELRGLLAGAVWDGTQLHLFRDHLGLKTLFYRDAAQGLVAASEAKAVAAGAGIREEPDLAALRDILYGRTSDETGAALLGVSRLPKATVLTAGPAARATRTRYWQPERLLETARLDEDEITERFHELFGQAVRRALQGDDAVSLSGGIDSPAVAAYAAPGYAERTGRRLGALSAVFPDLPSVDESAYIELVAERLGMELHTYRPAGRSLDAMERWAALLDGPVPTVSVPELDENYCLARELGYRTLLTGELAEFVIDQRMHLLGHLLVHRRVRAARTLVRQQRRRGVRWSTIGRQAALPLVPGRVAAAVLDLTGASRGDRIPDWLDHREVNRTPYRDDLLPSPGRRWPAQQLAAFPGPGVTLEADEAVAAMHGVTVRRPFADVDLWEFFLSLRAEDKFPASGSKVLVRRLLRGRVPDEILDRRDKTVFNDHVVSHADYPVLRGLLSAPGVRIPGVRYDRLAQRLQAEDLGIYDVFWARDLASVHAFLRRWEDA